MTKSKFVPFLAGILMLLPLCSLRAQRESVPLADGWKFIRQDAAPNAAYDSWETVTVPHTFNQKDGEEGKTLHPEFKEGYYRGPAWYVKEIDIPDTWKGKRVFVRFEAASLVADVYLNDQSIGEHRGGFAAFCMELTPFIKYGAKNVLRVKVDNTRFDDIAPLSGDFTVFGGLYRPVHLIATDPVGITLLDHGSLGVYLTQKKVSAQEAVVEVQAKISNSGSSAAVTVQADLLGADGQQVQTVKTDATVPPGPGTPVTQTLTIAQPHLWNGRKDPYLYQVHVKLLHDGTVIDEVDQNLGLRTVEITQDRGFLLNGQPYALHGVNRHQELAGKGWALSDADHEVDHQMIVDIGATCLRLAHYQQSNYFHDLTDKSGLIVWQEVPLVNGVKDSPAFNDNAKQQLTEMIMQGYNHPSLCMWGIYNELGASWIKEKSAAPEPLLKDLHKLAKELDPSRPVVAASQSVNAWPMHSIPDWQAYNIYPGWYPGWGKATEFAKVIGKASGNLANRRIGISEYGAGANTAHHQEGPLADKDQPKADGPFHPEEWQDYVHENAWSQMQKSKRLWGTFIWAMFDFSSAGRTEGGQPAINDKGLVTHDRSIKKDTFYFYQANWSDKPMVYIASRRMTPRVQPVTDVKVYSNCPQVELKVNGKSLGTQKPNDIHVFIWKSVKLQPDRNEIEVSGGTPEAPVSDSCEWMLTTKKQ